MSEGQFYQVLLYELDAIRKVRLILSCLSYYPDSDVKQTEFLWSQSLGSFVGLCFIRTELSTACDLHCGAKTASHQIIS